jgi:alpha-beta hydrolase superfamily lysophospholipase
VLLVLLALLVLCAPFLMTARNADEASRHVGENVQVRLSHDAAERHSRGVLAESHPALDQTRDYDSLAELTVGNDYAAEFLDARDAGGVMWDVEVVDESGRIDLNSANPQVLANALGLVSLLIRVITKEDTEIPVVSTKGLATEGLLVVYG